MKSENKHFMQLLLPSAKSENSQQTQNLAQIIDSSCLCRGRYCKAFCL